MNRGQRRGRRSGAALVWVSVWLAWAGLVGQAAEPVEPLTLDRVLGGEFNASGYGARWDREQAVYYRFEDGPGAVGRDLVRYDAATGEKEVLVQGQWLVPPGSSRPLSVEGWTLSPDRSRLLIYTNSRRVWRANTRGDYWLLDLTSHELRQLGGEGPEATMMFATFSPDGRHVAYVRQNNLFVQSLDDFSIRQLTRDGDDQVINGTFDWVYEEELSLRKGFHWSPDGQWLVFWQVDTSRVPEFVMIDNISGLYPRLVRFAYPKTGQTNSAVRLGLVSVQGGDVRWIEVPGDPREHYLARVQWLDHPREVVIQQLDRRQHTNQLWFASVEDPRARPFFAETDPAWVDVRDDHRWIEEDQTLLWLSERDGWRHVWRIPRRKGRPQCLTPGDYDVIELLAVDKERGCFYFLASPENATERYLWCAPLKGGKARRLTPTDQAGWHSYDISPDGRWAIHTWSTFTSPPIVDLVELPEHTRVRVFEENEKLRKKLARLPAVETSFFQVETEPGVLLDGWLLKPPGFDPSLRYPTFFHVYGEPAGQTVLNRWGGRNAIWHRFLAEQGYVVLSVDNRGTPAPKGRQWRKCIYGQVGILASADQAAALRALQKRWSWMDPERVGIWGWSGGGSMTLNALFRYPDLYQVGMSVAPVPNMRLYDTIYQERYMGLPSENPEGYLKGSPLTYAHQLRGKLLLVHGTGDDNVHYQGMEALIDELVAHGKSFRMMAYPNRTHSIREGVGTTRHLYRLLTSFLTENLPAGPRQPSPPPAEAPEPAGAEAGS
ncbi:MAG: S9 family peptidase [Verrucomicrobia bacterium]|nr:MAG: S9 family peptidase [Verrucomicrobiota bacterium]